MQKNGDIFRQGDWGVKRSVFICTVNDSIGNKSKNNIHYSIDNHRYEDIGGNSGKKDNNSSNKSNCNIANHGNNSNQIAIVGKGNNSSN